MRRTLMVAGIFFCVVIWAGNPLGAQETIETLEAGRQCITLTFEGIPSGEDIDYPTEVGVILNDQEEELWRAVDTLGYGVSNNPSGTSVAVWWIVYPNQWPPGPLWADIVFEEPVSAVALYYTSLFDVTVEVFDSEGAFLEAVPGLQNIVDAFDTWDLLDVERYANEIASVRITGAAQATMIDDFKFCRTLGPQALSDALIDEVQLFYEDSILNQQQSQALIRKLNRVTRLIENGRQRAARRSVRAFTRQVKRLVRRDILTAADGQFLIGNAGAIEFTPAE